MKHIYVAGPWQWREHVGEFADRVNKIPGVSIIEPWWEHPDTQDSDDLAEQADNDLRAVVECDLLVVLDYQLSEGKMVEMGVALTVGVPIFVTRLAGKPKNIFQYLPEVVEFESEGALLEEIERWATT
jgi:nucleoside 2-deoxyribosyltransferase